MVLFILTVVIIKQHTLRKGDLETMYTPASNDFLDGCHVM